MRLVIIASGTRGDVAPYTGLGARLAAAGHHVTVSAHAEFAGLVAGAGLDHHPLPGDVREVISVPSSDRPPSPMFLNRRLPQLRRYLLEVADGVLEATASAELVLVNGATPFAYHAADARGIPSMGVYLQPFEPSADYPSPITNSARSLGRWGNRRVAEFLLAGLWPYTQAGNRIRTKLGLPAEGAVRTRRRQRTARWPIFHGYSPAVLPPGRDWRPGLAVTGYWWPHEPADWQPPARLRQFLDAGPAPVLITFGSMAAGSGRWLTDAVIGAVRAAGVRAVVQAGAARLDLSGSDDLLTIGSVPHGWLMARSAAVVHHAGAGTTAAGLRAGIPAVTTPIYADQPMWGRRLSDLGLGPRPIPFTRQTAERLGAAIRDAVTHPRYRDRAQELAARIATEDGAAPVLAAVDRLTRSPSPPLLP
jgi:UDP:flavonoid glycosyltransferase YjiC (YdhE family)